jgi:hypothetical protein
MNTTLKTDNQVKIELNKNSNRILKRDDILSNSSSFSSANSGGRYGINYNLSTNKVTTISDGYLSRNQNFQENVSNVITNYKISRINIDSRFRNKDPKNIIDKYLNLNSPFEFKKNSNIMKINIPFKHSIKVNDNITISNVQSLKKTLLPSTLTLKKNSSYIYINYVNHGLTENNNIVKISNVKNNDVNNYYFNNIPLSLINNSNYVNIIDSDNLKININIFSDNDYNYDGDTYDVEFITLNGVHIKYINASYPIINDVQQGYLSVVESSSNYINVKLSVNASYDTEKPVGNDNIQLGVITSTIDGYPDPEYYRFDLKKTYYKVKKIKLVSSEIPNTEMLIKSKPDSIKNNSFYFQILDDADTIYKAEIAPGNYTASSLSIELSSKINNIDRVFGNYILSSTRDNYYGSCISNITINPANNLFSIQILSTITLSKAIVTEDINEYSDSYYRIIVTHPYHNLNAGDSITISGSTSILQNTVNSVKYYIPENIINKTHIIESVRGLNNYVIKLPKYNAETNTVSTNNDTGGNAISITYPLSIRLLFNYSDTFGSVLGFKNAGDENSITNYAKIITNNTLYVNNSNINSVGLPNNNVAVLNFKTYPYILMVSEIFNPVINYKDSTGVFAKLGLGNEPGSIIYDQYVQITEDIPNTFTFLNELQFQFLTPDGKTYNFNGYDHSYTLEIYEELEVEKRDN